MGEKELKEVLAVGSLSTVEGIPLGKRNGKAVCLPADTRLNRHIAVFGASGTGKSRGFIRPALFNIIRRGESAIITDSKGELHADTAELFPVSYTHLYDWLAGASNYKNLIENGNISAYAFRTKQELLSSGLAEKGDIILMWWSNSPGADGADNHIGFFWGEASDDDVMWHSGTEPSSGNQISTITPKTPGSFYILIKIEPCLLYTSRCV